MIAAYLRTANCLVHLRFASVGISLLPCVLAEMNGIKVSSDIFERQSYPEDNVLNTWLANNARFDPLC